jgi:hypothetical protein
MNLDGPTREELARALRSNTLALFLGAGFSTGATNQLDEPIPTGETLCRKLWSFLRFTQEYDGTSLQDLFELCLSRDKKQLAFLLRDLFTSKDLAKWYQLLPKIYWYRIYTTNIDDVVEKIYAFGKVGTALEVVNGQSADYKDRDQFLETIQLVKLNGVDLSNPDGLTFSFLQYARRASENPTWYDHFVRDYSTHPVVFLGSKLDEPLFWQALEARGKRFGGKERRSKAFVVSPSFSTVVRQKFHALGLIPIEGTAQEFLEAIALPENLLTREQIISQSHPEVAHQLAATGEVSHAQRVHIQEFLSGFHIVRQPERMPRVEKEFLLGAGPDWADIYSNLDAHRDCEDTLLSVIQERLSDPGPSGVLVSGWAGSGKSTVMKRVALQLASAGTQVLFADPFYTVASHHIAPALATFREPLAVFVDDARTLLPTLGALIDAARLGSRRIVIIAGERGNRGARVMQRLAALPNPEEFEMPNLSDRDIDALIDKLSEFNLLGQLAGKTRNQQRYEFSIRAEKQILVAMREATQGDSFDHIIESELESIESNEAKIAYLAICLATTFGNHLTIDQFLSLIDVFPNEALDLLDTQLKGIVLRREPHRRAVQARHRIIAEALLDTLAPRLLVKEAYIRLLQTLAHDLDFTQPNRSKVFRLYRDVINHRLIQQRFRAEIASARSVFQSLEGYLKHDYHFLLQYASLELEYDELATAENYLAQAEELAPRTDDFIQTTKAMLFYKQAAASQKLHEATVMRDEARKILLSQIEERPDDPYPAHVLCAQELEWIEQWPSRFEERLGLMSSLRDEAVRLLKRYPYSRKLEAMKKRIEERYLEMAAPRIKEEGGTV